MLIHQTNKFPARDRMPKHLRAAAKPAPCADPVSGPNLACIYSGPVVYAYRLNFICIGLLCRQRGGKTSEMSQFRPIFTFWEALVSISLYQSRPNLAANSISLPTVYANTPNFIESVACVTFQGQKRNFWQILTFGGSCTQPLYQ